MLYKTYKYLNLLKFNEFNGMIITRYPMTNETGVIYLRHDVEYTKLDSMIPQLRHLPRFCHHAVLLYCFTPTAQHR